MTSSILLRNFKVIALKLNKLFGIWISLPFFSKNNLKGITMGIGPIWQSSSLTLYPLLSVHDNLWWLRTKNSILGTWFWDPVNDFKRVTDDFNRHKAVVNSLHLSNFIIASWFSYERLLLLLLLLLISFACLQTQLALCGKRTIDKTIAQLLEEHKLLGEFVILLVLTCLFQTQLTLFQSHILLNILATFLLLILSLFLKRQDFKKRIVAGPYINRASPTLRCFRIYETCG